MDSRNLQQQLKSLQDEQQQLQREQVGLERQRAATEQQVADLLLQIRTVVTTAVRLGETFDWTSLDEHVQLRFGQLDQHQQVLLDRLHAEETAASADQQQLQQALAAHGAASAALASLDASLETLLEQRPEVQESMRTLGEIELLTERLRQQQAESAEDAADKRRAYEEDRYFAYLHQRGFSESRYVASSLTRRFDRWLAARCHYQTNAAQYAVLLAIPARLQATLDEAKAEMGRLEDWISAQREQLGVERGRPALVRHVEKAAAELAGRKAVMAEHARRIAATQQEIQCLTSGDHPLHSAIASMVADKVQGPELARFVATTLSQEDDRLLPQLERAQLLLCQLQAGLATNGALQQLKRNELETLEHELQRTLRLEEAALRALSRRRRPGPGPWDGGWGDGGFGGGRRGGLGGAGFGGGGFGSGGGFGGGGFKRGGGF
ncbi:MAG: hypothetical protein ACO280_00515 [Pseudohongiellaceae bacterium]